jgi:hypothetical protein
MSTKSTILSTKCCHIYRDYKYKHTCGIITNGEEFVLVIEVDYGFVDYNDLEDQSTIVVDYNSDFAKMIIMMIDKVGADDIEKFVKGLNQTE